MITIIYMFNKKSGILIENSIKSLAFSEGQTISEVMKTAGLYLLKNGEEKFINFLSKEFNNKKVVYLALLKNRELFYADSKFEGYLPIDENNTKNLRIIDSPSGKIMEVGTNIEFNHSLYQVKIGYLFDSLSVVRKIRNRNILTITLIQVLIILIMLYLIFKFNAILRNKEVEIQKEKDEKERFHELLVLMAGINHEIKNPLNSLYLSFQVLDNFIDKKSEEAVFYTNSLKKEIKRIADILDKYGNLNKKISINQESIDLESFFNEMEIIFKGISEKIKINMKLSIKKIFSDPNLLKQIFLNLYKNSFEAGADEIKIQVLKERDYIKIIYEDNGEGIKEPDKIFVPFYSTKSQNSGLGMVMVKRIINALGGEIRVETGNSKGARFILLLKEGKSGRI